MNNPNPFVPKGSLLEQQSKRRSRMKLGVLCVLVVGVAGLTAMLIQGCKREQNNEAENTPPPAETNAVVVDTNPPPMEASNPPVAAPPVVAPAPVPEVAGTEYVVVKGDSFAKIAKKNGVSVKAIEAANPGVEPTKLKVGQKLSIPASAGGAAASAMAGGQASAWFKHGRRNLHGEIRRYADQDCEGARHHRQGDQSCKRSDDGPYQSRAEAEDSGESRSCGSGTRAGSSCARARADAGHGACACRHARPLTAGLIAAGPALRDFEVLK